MRPNLNCIQYVRRLESVVMYLFRSVLTIFVLSGFGLNLLTQLDGGLAAASTQKGLTPDAATYAAQCQRTLHSYDHDFAPEISVAAGCDCMARTLASDTSADFGAAGALLVGLVVQPAETKIPDNAPGAGNGNAPDLVKGHAACRPLWSRSGQFHKTACDRASSDHSTGSQAPRSCGRYRKLDRTRQSACGAAPCGILVD